MTRITIQVYSDKKNRKLQRVKLPP